MNTLVSKIPQQVFLNIFDFLPTSELDVIRKVSKEFFREFRDYIYYRLVSSNATIVSNDYLIHYDFNLMKFIEDETFRVIHKIRECPYFCLAGGSMTQCFLGRSIKSTSDIDVFILGGLGEAEATRAFHEFLRWFSEEFPDFYIETLGWSNSIITIHTLELAHPIQFIFTASHSLMEVLSSFDNSHNRCGVYLETSYVAPDALAGSSTLTTYFYKPNTIRRYRKARDLGFRIYNFTEEENERLLQITFEPKENTNLKYTYKQFMKSFLELKFVKQWINHYTLAEDNSLNTPIEFNLADYHKTKDRDLLQFDFNGNKLEAYITQPTDIHGLLIRRPVNIVVDLELQAIDTPHKLAYKKQLMTLKKTLLDIMTAAHGFRETPQHILTETRDLIGPERYREICLEKRDKLIDVVNRTVGITKATVLRDIKEGRHADNMYRIYGGRFRLFYHLGYEYRDYIRISDEHMEGFLQAKDPSMTTVSNQGYYKKYRIMCVGRKSKSQEAKFCTFGYWDYKVVKQI
jgi:hypothetical protein